MSIKFTTIPSRRLAASMTAATLTLKVDNILGWDGNALTSADFGTTAYAILRNDANTLMEIIEIDPSTIANASITVLKRGLKFDGDLTTQVTANKLTWVKNETIVELGTDVPQMLETTMRVSGDQSVAGIKTFSSSPIVPTPTTATQAANKSYVDGVAIAGGADASTTVKGIAKASVAPASATEPIFVGDNDPRVPTQDENNALAGQSGTAVSGTNKLIDNADTATSATANKVVRAGADGKIHYSFLNFGGTGADGALSITSGTTTIDLGGQLVVVKNYTSISITGTGALAFTNPNASGTVVVLRSQGDTTITSSANPVIDLRNMGAAGGAANGANNGTTAVGYLFQSGGGVAGAGSPGGGGTLAINLALQNSNLFDYSGITIGAGGGTGQGAGAQPAGGRGGGSLVIECNGAFNFTNGTISTVGTQGTASAGGISGSGGSGSVYIRYRTLTANTGTINVASTAGLGTGGGTYNAGGGGAGATAGGAGSGTTTGGAGGAGVSIVSQVIL